MSRKKIREKKEKKLEELKLKKNFQIFINLVIFSGAAGVQGCFPNIKVLSEYKSAILT